MGWDGSSSCFPQSLSQDQLSAWSLVTNEGSGTALVSGTNIYVMDPVDTSCFLLCVIIVIWLYFFSEPYRQGFWAGDRSIRYPYLPIIIPATPMLITAFIIPSIIILLTERKLQQPDRFVVWKRFAFSFVADTVIMLFFKFAVGRLRPHFLAVCQPDIDLQVDHFYEPDQCVCKPGSENITWQARQSFFSGHASQVMTAAVFLVLFLQDRFERSLVKTTIQMFIILIGLYPGITQHHNYWHHASDVLSGHIVGSIVGTACYYWMWGGDEWISSVWETFEEVKGKKMSSSPKHEAKVCLSITHLTTHTDCFCCLAQLLHIICFLSVSSSTPSSLDPNI